MEKIITIDQLSKINSYTLFDSYLFVDKKFASFHLKGLSNRSILSSIGLAHSLNKKAYVLLDRVLFNDELEDLKVYLYKLEEKGCDGYFFSDLGVLSLLKEMGILGKGIFYSQTQIVSSLELESYASLGLKGVFVSNSLPLDDIFKASMRNLVGVNVFGYRNLFYSRRLLLSAYKDEFNLKGKFIDSSKYLIREQKRESKSIIFENQYGTYVFTSYIDNHINQIAKFLDHHVSYILFDDNFIKPSLMEKVIAYLSCPQGRYSFSEKEVDTYEQE